MRHAIIALCLVIVLPSLVAAQDRPLLEAALAQATTAPISPERERSMARTWWGVAMIAGGTAMVVSAAGTECAESDLVADLAGVQTCDDVQSTGALGLVLVGAGALLATIWSDVPVVRDLTIGATSGRVQVGRTFGW